MERNPKDLKETYGLLLKVSLLIAISLHLVGFLAKREIGLHPLSLRVDRTDTLWMFPEDPPPNTEEPPPIERPRPNIQPAEPDDPEAVETIVTDSEAWNRPPLDLPTPEFRIDYEEPPVAITRVKPVYPPLAKLGRIQGTVYVIAYIDAGGRVVKVEIGGSVHQSLDRAALEAVKGWRFSPAKMRDKPVAVMVGIPITFELR